MLPNIISVDDHVVEPPDLWTSRLPTKYQRIGPRLERRTVQLQRATGGVAKWTESREGSPCDAWVYEDLLMPLTYNYAAAGLGDLDFRAVTFEDYPLPSRRQGDRLSSMTANGVDAAVCFPNTLPRFCGQTFLEANDKSVALACVQAYNDWVIEEWSGGSGSGRLIPVTLVPLWDIDLAVAEIRRCAEKGSFAITFPENPYPLGLPSLHQPYWDPIFAVCQEADVVICMHVGSSSRNPTTSSDAPYIISSLLLFENSLGSLLDFIFSGILERFPKLTLVYAEGQVGWLPYILEQADRFWSERSANAFGSSLRNPPSTYLAERVYTCIFHDRTGLLNREAIGMSQICFETDYPHADSNFPHSQDVLDTLRRETKLSDAETYQLARGNAIRAFGLSRFGWTS
jgi:predicted TIM-barrel fold metal-dependent hydrolase